MTLTWDANGSASPGPLDGSGNWNVVNDWWNGSANQSWASGSDAIFGSGVGSTGTYFVTNNSALMQPNSITFTNPGNYTISTDGIDVGELSWTAAAGGVGSTSKGLWVGTNVSTCINVPWDDANGSDIFLGSNSVLTFSQGNFGSLGTLLLKGSGAASSIVNSTNGAWTGLPGTMDISGVTLDVSNSGAIDAGTRLDIGRPATGAPGSDGIVNVGNGGQFNVNVTADTDPNANLQVSRGGSGILNISSGGFVSTLSDGTSGRVLLIPDSGSQAMVNMSGGTLNMGTGINGTPGLNSSLLNLITLMQGAMSYGGSASAIFNLSGGVATALGIQIGSTNGTFTANPTNQINVTGGILYLGALNISRPISTGTKSIVNFSGGTIAAIANWSPACSIPINLTNINGDITFQAADGRGNPFDISIAGPMTGVGGFKATGNGILTLTGTNTYAGFTGINGGTVLLAGQGSIVGTSGIGVTNGGTLILFNTSTANSTNRISNTAPITMDDGTFSFLNDSSAANFNEAAGGLVIDSGANIITVFPATNSDTSQLVFNSVTDIGGSVNFLMASAGTSQNKVLFNTPPTIGSWVTVNGDSAAYDSVNGLQSAVSYTDISALGSTIVNASSSNVRIRTMGVGGNIQLNSSAIAINSLKQDTTTPAIVNVANDVFQVNDIAVYAGAQPLTIGTSPDSGMLEAGTAGGDLVLDDDGGFAPGLVINAAVIDNTFPSSLTVSGGGTVVLCALNNTYSGGTTINGGTLIVAAGTTVAMAYTNVSGTLETVLDASGVTLPMTGFVLSGNQPQVGFNLMTITNSPAPVISISGNLMLNGNVYV
ncbi:MAG TPA: autotransporter-associated beta strand repeat-containing protein, partial [Candidatus Acidoferrum sp.]|nr:autotransporter-associated beta strand repeat-containing protein [Candidatus Acidoferrum sp.]